MWGGEILKGIIIVKEEMILERLKNVNNEGDFILSRLYVVDILLFLWDNDIKFLVNLLVDVKEEGKLKCFGGEKGMLNSIFEILFVYKIIVMSDI